MTPPSFEPIGWVRSPIASLDAAPNQGLGTEVVAHVEVRPELRDGLLGLDRYEHVWLLFEFDRQGPFTPEDLRLVPSGTGTGSVVQGVFASRSPRRPNGIGLSLVRQESLDAATGVLTFSGVDLVDGTPVLDIKPWFADADLPGS